MALSWQISSVYASNLYVDTHYSVVKKVVHDMLHMRIVKDLANEDFDLYWTDNAITN
jgi:hypothetical protein